MERNKMAPENNRSPLNEREAAEYIGMSTSYLRCSRMRGATKCTDAPPFVRIGKSIRYLPRDLDAWLESRRQSPGEAA
jgi:predicted DNA-binding transcriptional regulator AlpA